MFLPPIPKSISVRNRKSDTVIFNISGFGVLNHLFAPPPVAFPQRPFKPTWTLPHGLAGITVIFSYVVIKRFSTI